MPDVFGRIDVIFEMIKVVVHGFQIDSSSKRPVSSVTCASRRPEGTLPFLRPTPLRRRSGEAKERKQTIEEEAREPCRLALDAGRSVSGQSAHPLVSRRDPGLG